MRRVILESPYAGEDAAKVAFNVAYAYQAMLDSLSRGEAPIASHLLYTQMLDDKIPEHRRLGIDAGIAWRVVAECAVFYVDLGWSRGMKEARKLYRAEGTLYEVRRLYESDQRSAVPESQRSEDRAERDDAGDPSGEEQENRVATGTNP